jgi:succinate dehydrogenase / fumarate reductase cytochrome b subunit
MIVQLFWHFGIFYDFGFQKWCISMCDASPLNETRYFHELAEKFESPIRTGLYLSFYYYHCTCGTGSVLLSTVGFNNKYSRSLFRICFCNRNPFGSFFIALFHHLIINIKL